MKPTTLYELYRPHNTQQQQGATAMKVSKTEKQEALSHLRSLLPPGSTVHTILRHVSSSGMMRAISPIVIKNGESQDVTYWVSRVLGEPIHPKHYGVKMSGCGMDMGFHLVYSLSYALYPDSFSCIGQGCPSNDHSNGDRDYTPHLHSDAGYALRHKWL